jgi:hypothetical protein
MPSAFARVNPASAASVSPPPTMPGTGLERGAGAVAEANLPAKFYGRIILDEGLRYSPDSSRRRFSSSSE